MSDKNFKTLRKQITNVVQSILPEVMTNELVKAVHEKLAEQVEKRLESLSAHMKSTLEKIDERTKEIQMYTVRNSITPAAPAPEQVAQPSETPSS